MMVNIPDPSLEASVDNEFVANLVQEFPFVCVATLSRVEHVTAETKSWFAFGSSKKQRSLTSKPQRVRLSVCCAVHGQTPARWLIETDCEADAVENGESSAAAALDDAQPSSSYIGLADAQVCSSSGVRVVLSFAHCSEKYVVECSTPQQAELLRLATASACSQVIYTNIRTSDLSTCDIQPGDVVLIRTTGFESTLQRLVTRCRWDHVAIVLPEAWGVSRYFGEHTETLSLYEVTNSDGVFSCPLRSRIEQYLESGIDVEVAVRHLVADSSECRAGLAWEHLYKLYDASLGREYSFRGLVGIAATSAACVDSPRAKHQRQHRAAVESDALDLLRREQNSTKVVAHPSSCQSTDKGLAAGSESSSSSPASAPGYFCSELVACCFAKLGLMDRKLSKRPAFYWPSSFQPGDSIDQHLIGGFHLTEPVIVHIGVESDQHTTRR